MAVVLGPASNSGTRGTTQETLSHTCGVGTTLLMVVAMSRRSSGLAAVTSVTFDGDALTKLGDLDNDGGYSSLWYRVNPAITTANIVVEYGAAPGVGVFGGLSFLGADPPIGYTQVIASGVTTWTRTPTYDAKGYYVAGCPSSQHSTGWYGSQQEISGSSCYCAGEVTNYARQAQGYYKIGSDMDPFVWESPRTRWAVVTLCTVPAKGAGGQIIWMFSKMQDFLKELKLGRIPANKLLEQYGEMLPI